MGRRNALRLLTARLAGARTAPLNTPAGQLLVRSWGTDVLMVADVLFRGDYAFPFPLLDDHRPGERPQLIVDAGANVGSATRYFLQRFPAATVVAIEPDPGNFALLAANCAAHPRAVLINRALWPESTRLALDHSLAAACAVRTHPPTSPSSPATSPPSSPATCDTLTMQELIASHGPVDLLKLDIEGAEAQLFAPGRDLSWLEQVASIVIELHDRYEPGCSRHFWAAVDDFPVEACRGENHYVSRRGA
ncbi:MAG: FkbM family methyltransferase [Cyanobium sp. M30B3]|nr:MAG: FkbM family methyltransferase [Cyanobium sp. M30B3]